MTSRLAGQPWMRPEIVTQAGQLKLLKLTDRAEEERSRQLGELRPYSLIAAARGGALVQEPTPHRHIYSDASTATSTRRLNCSR